MRKVHTTPEMGNLPTSDLWRLDGATAWTYKVLFENIDDRFIKNKGLKVMKYSVDYGPDPIGHRRADISKAVKGDLKGQHEYESALRSAMEIQNTFSQELPFSQKIMPNSELELAGKSLIDRITAVRSEDFATQIAALNGMVKEDPVELYVSPLHTYLSGLG